MEPMGSYSNLQVPLWMQIYGTDTSRKPWKLQQDVVEMPRVQMH